MIAIHCEGNHKLWDVKLPELGFAFNSSKSKATGFSPYYVLFGREPTCHKRERYAIPEEVLEDPDEHSDRVKTIQDLARQKNNQENAQNIQRYNLRRRDWVPHVGDIVALRTHVLSSAPDAVVHKLSPKFKGPYVVKKVISPTRFNLKSESDTLSNVHIAQLRPFQTMYEASDSRTLLPLEI